jgi:hypothetical protein
MEGIYMTGSVLWIFTLFHVALSLVGIGSGLIVIVGFLKVRSFDFWNKLFLVTTIATSVTGFLFPFKGITPGIVTGTVSMIVLAFAVIAFWKGLRRTFVITVAIAQYLNVLVLIVQLFEKTPAHRVYAPAGSGPVVSVEQLSALLVFLFVAIVSIRRSGRRLDYSAPPK